ncbi:MAG: hypothetical protein CMJ58_12150 [Planctomycetaceae bacterium]|nr:hypothetical protein [Planctomycetaceae bacterium]
MSYLPRATRFYTFLLALGPALLIVAQAAAQTGPVSERAARRSRASRDQAAASALQDADQAAEHFLDVLMAPEAPADPLADAASSALGVPSSRASRRGGFSGTLVYNPNESDGNPPYALVDRYGGVARYIEPVESIDLDAFIGETVSVRRDTGGTLLASQLNLPRSPVGAGVMLAQHEEELPPGAIIEGEDGVIMEGDQGVVMEGEPLYLDDGLDFPMHSHGYEVGCPSCGSMLCPPGGCGYGARPIFYARADYLMMWAKGMQTPPLVVRGEVNEGSDAGPADDFFDNAFIVYGNEEILKGQRNGGRVTLGYWLDDYGQLGIEGEYLALGKIEERFVDGGNGMTPIVGRPYIEASTGFFTSELPNLVPPGENAVEDVSFPGVMGTVTVDSQSEFNSASVRLRRNLCCVGGCGPECGDCVVGCGSGVDCGSGVGCTWLDDPYLPMFARGRRHVDLIAGVRWMELDENLRIVEDLTATTTPATTFLLTDNFATNNEFFGGELGFIWDWNHRRWSFEFLSKLGLGNTRQQVAISGSNLRDGVDLKENSGLLAQPSNVGVYERNVFAVIPELGVTLGYDLTERLRFNVGYSFIYWSRVARPGDQIDLNVNSDYLPFPGDTDYTDPNVVAPARPQFVFRDSDFWVQGVTLGFLYQY